MEPGSDKNTRRLQTQINTYAEMWHASGLFQLEEAGSYHNLMASLIFAAFALEAFCNHIGEHIFGCWGFLEGLSPLAKIELIHERLSLPLDKGRRPYETLKVVFNFRNELAHGKTDVLTDTEIINNKDNEQRKRMLEAEWQKSCNKKFIGETREDADKMMREIFKATEEFIRTTYPDEADDRLYRLDILYNLSSSEGSIS